MSLNLDLNLNLPELTADLLFFVFAVGLTGWSGIWTLTLVAIQLIF